MHHYGTLIRALVQVTEPTCCVECGILEGYSTILIGHTLKKIGKRAHLYAYDLFEDYAYAHAVYDDIVQKIGRYELKDVVTLRKGDLFDAAQDFEDTSVDFLHIDISNTGEVIRKSIEQWDQKIKPGGLLLYEGGSPLRDEVDWINRYKKEKMFPEIQSNQILREKYTFVVIQPYPSMLICSKNLQADDQTLVAFGYDAYTRGNVHGFVSEEDLLRDLVR